MKIDELIQRKVEGKKRWLEANPQFEGVDDWHATDEEKIYISKELLHSEAYRSLTKNALLVYQDFLAKRILKPIKRNGKKYWVHENNGEMIYPYQEAEEKGFLRSTFRNAIDELQQNGLIDITHQGKGGRKPRKGSGDVTLYLIDDRWRDYGTPNFRAPRKPRIKDKRTGRGFAAIWKDQKKASEMLAKRDKTISEKQNISIKMNTR